MNPKAIDHKLESEVLVIGSGLAGSLAAIKCHQLGMKVVIVNKGPLCGSGATILCAGFPMNICFPTDDKDLWMKEFVEAGEYVIDQEWVKIHLEEGYGYSMELDQLGKEYHEPIFPRDPRDKKDEPWHFQDFGNKFPMTILFNGFAAEAALKKKILADGIDFFERVDMTNLLSDGQRVVGAVGFNHRNGETYLFRAKAVILAAGGNYFTVGVADNGGEGTRMAYEAGASIRSLDKGGAIFRSKNAAFEAPLGDVPGMGLPYHLFGAKLVNRLGEAFLEKAAPELKSAGRQGMLAAISKEVTEGRGPVFEDYTQIPLEMQEVLKMLKKAFWKATKSQYGVDVFKDRIPFSEEQDQIAIPAAQSRSGGGVEVDYQCASTVPGLYAIGDCSCSNIGVQHPFRGVDIGWALLSGSRVAKFAAQYATSTPSAAINEKEILDQAKGHFASLALPLTRISGVSPHEVASSLLRILIPYDKVHCHKDSLERALSEIARLQREDLPRVKTKDYHELKKAVEVQAMVLNAEMVLRSELFREESRLGVRRNDFPMTDNINWLKWVIVEKRDNKMYIYSKDVPTPYIPPPPTSYPPRLLRV